MQRAIQNDKVGFISLCILVFLFQALAVYSQEFSWVKHLAASPRVDECTGVGTDAQGNVYVAGSVSLSGRFDGKELAAGEGGGFLAKYNSEGVQQWVRWREVGGSIAVDSVGNVYGSGWLTTSLTIGDTVLTSDGESCYLIKYDTEGRRLWIRVVPGKSYPTIACNSIGEVSIGVRDRGAQYATSATVRKYNADGELLWRRYIESEQNCPIVALAMNAEGDVALTGTYSANVVLSDTVLQKRSDNNIYILRYSAAGELVWASPVWLVPTYSHSMALVVRDIVFGKEREVVLIGGFRGGRLYVGTDSLENPYSNYESSNIFIAKYGDTGEVVWLRGTDGKRDEIGKGLAVDSRGSIYVAGMFTDSVFFNEHRVVSKGHSDLFVAKYSPLGAIEWVQQSGSQGSSISVRRIAVDSGGNLYVAATSMSPQLVVGDSTFTNAGETDGFMFKLTGVSTAVADASPVSLPTLMIFPHPVTAGAFHVELPVSVVKGELVVNDVLGRRIYSQTVQGIAEGTPVRVLLPNVPEGLYVLVLRSATGVVASSTFVVGR